jgi:hypothetical protein
VAQAPHLLFAPRGGHDAVGEALRTLILAKAARRRWPGATIEFVSRPLPLFEAEGFRLHPVEAGISKDQAAAIAVLERTRPGVLVLDNHGRTPILARASGLGVRTVFIADHEVFFDRLFRSRRLRFIDQLWIVQRRFGSRTHGLPWPRRLRLALLRGPSVHTFDTILPELIPGERADVRRELGLGSGPYVLFAAGGGGYRHGGRPVSDVFAEAARHVHEATRMPCVVVMGPLHPEPVPEIPGVVVVKSLVPEAMIELISGASIVACGGGSTSSQAMALGRVCVVAPAGGPDQPVRIEHCAAEGLVEASPLEAKAIAERVCGLVEDAPRCAAIEARIEACGFRNGVAAALDQLALLSGHGAG